MRRRRSTSLEGPVTIDPGTRETPTWFRSYLLAALLCVGVASALLAPALQPGTILAPVDLIYETPGFAGDRPSSYNEPANPHLFDQTYQFVPWRHHAWQRLRSGDIPLWNPLSATGSPFVATLQSAVFYPVNLLALPLPFETTFVFSALIRLWIAGFATYALLRRYGSSHMAGLISATSFMLSAFIIGWLGHPHTNVAVWLPALILAVEGVIASPARHHAMRWWAVLALVTGVQFLGGHIETSRDILLAAGLYAIVRLVQQAGVSATARLSRLASTGAAVICGIGFAAVQLLPFLEWLPLSAEYQQRSGGGFVLWNLDARQLVALPLAIMPNLYNNPTWSGDYWSFNPWGSFNESVLYAGLIPLGLAIGALSSWKRDSVVRAWTITGGIALGLALQIPILDWFNQLPGIALGHPGRLRLIAIFAVTVLAGRGLDCFVAATRDSRAPRWMVRFLLVALTFVVTVAALFNVVLPRMSDWESRSVSRGLSYFSGSTNPPRSVAICRERIDACGDELASAFAISNVEMYLPAMIALAALIALRLVFRQHVSSARLAPVLIALTCAELILTGWGFNPAVDASILETHAPWLEAASERGGRITVLQQDTLPDSHMLFVLSDVRGLDFKTARYERYLDASGARIPWIANGVLLEDAGPLITALDVQTIVTANRHIVAREEAQESMSTVAVYGDLTLLQPARTLPRATMFFDAEVAGSDEATARVLAADPESVFTRVVLAHSPEARDAIDALGGEDSRFIVVENTTQPERLAWTVTTDRPGLLFVSDAYYPGWTASIDGQPADILRANIAFRAVLVPAGEHQIEMRYEPRSFRYGAAISLVALALTAAIAMLSFLPSSRRRGDQVISR